jgi:hypothetical protein
LTFGAVADASIAMPFIKEDGTESDLVLDGNSLLEPNSGEFVFTPKVSAESSAEGTMFYSSDDKYIYVATT